MQSQDAQDLKWLQNPNTQDNWPIAQWQHEQIPTDGAWKSVEYKCIPKKEHRCIR